MSVSSSDLVRDRVSESSIDLAYLGSDSSMRAFATFREAASAVIAAALSESARMFSLTFSSLSSSFSADSSSTSAFMRESRRTPSSLSASAAGAERPRASRLALRSEISSALAERASVLPATDSSSSNFATIPAVAALLSTAVRYSASAASLADLRDSTSAAFRSSVLAMTYACSSRGRPTTSSVRLVTKVLSLSSASRLRYL